MYSYGDTHRISGYTIEACAGNPDGEVIANVGELLIDPGTGIIYRQTASPTGSSWTPVIVAGTHFETASDPSPPPSGLKIYSKEVAGRSMLTTLDANGIASPMQPSLAFKPWGHWGGQAGVATISASGNTPAVTAAAGTITARSQLATTFYTQQMRTAIVSGATAGSMANVRAASVNPKVFRGAAAGEGGFTAVFRFGVSDASLVSTAHMFVGLTAAGFSTDAAPSAGTLILGVGCDSGDTELQLYAAGASAQSRVSLGANFPVNTISTDVYELVLYARPFHTSVAWRVRRINTGHEASGVIDTAARLPASTTGLGPQFFRSNGGTAAAVGLDIMHMYLESG